MSNLPARPQWEGQDTGIQRRDFSDSLCTVYMAFVKFLRLSELLFLICEWGERVRVANFLSFKNMRSCLF